jgi:hypothetical protein
MTKIFSGDAASMDAIQRSCVVSMAGSKSLSGNSTVAAGDPYVLAIHLPPGFKLRGATIDSDKAETANHTEAATVSMIPSETETAEQKLHFEQ